VAAVVLVALNVRGPLAALPPVAGEVGADLAVTAGAVGLLTTLPVLCFGLASPLASALIARWGLRNAVLGCVLGVLAGTLLRSAGGYGAAVAGTLVLGLAITVGNIAMPVLVAEDFPAAVGLLTAVYTAAFNIGSTATTALTPLVAAGAGWRPALAAWGVVAVVAVPVLLLAQRGRARAAAARAVPDPGSEVPGVPDSAAAPAPARPGAADPRPVHRRPATWLLALAFGGQSFSYYGTTAWLPELLADQLGVSASAAGASAAVFQVAAVAGAFGVPLVLRTTGRPRVALWLVCAGWAVLPLGLLAAPELWWAWSAVAGAAQGGGITVVLVSAVARSTGSAEVRRTGTLVQGAGYALGASGPFVVGAAHDATGGWTAPLAVLLGAVAVLLLAGTPGVPRRYAPAR
jgi:CP family cyanate transporter-like MFS transporter